MPYTPPGIDVIQVLDESAVSTSAPAQPVVVIGPAFQIVTDETMGSYAGGSLVAAYASAGVVDVADPDPLALASELAPVTLALENVVVETLSEVTLGGDHLTTPIATTAGGAGTWAHLINATTLAWTVHAATDADAALLQVGDFISFDSLANVWRAIQTIDLTARTITWYGGAWPAAVAAGDLMSIVRPAIPDNGGEPGASTWEDNSVNFTTLGVALGDDLVVSRPSTFAGTLDTLAPDTGVTTRLNLDGSFVAGTRSALGTAQLTDASTAVTVAAGTADFTAIQALIAAGEIVAMYEPVSGAFIAIASVTDASNLVLAANWPANALGAPQAIQAAYMGPTATIGYSIRRARPDLALPRIDWDFLGVVVTTASVTVPASLTSGGFNIVAANLVGSYRALDETKAALVDYANLAALQADFVAGDAALIPSNPLGFAAKMALANTSNPVWTIGYDSTFYSSEATALSEALALLEESGMYTLVVCSMTGDLLAPALKTHIDDQSGQTKGYFRIGTFNRRRITQEEIVAATTTLATAPEGIQATGLTFTDVAHATGFVADGVIAGHQLQITQAVGPTQAFDGAATPSTRSFVLDNRPTASGAVIGDDLVIETGTDAGTYPITQVTDITVGGVITGGIITTAVGSVLTGDDVTALDAEVAATLGDPLAAGVVTVTDLVEAPMVAETLTLAADVGVVDEVITPAQPGQAAAATYTINFLGPIKAATVILLEYVGGPAATFEISIADAVDNIVGATTPAFVSIDRANGILVFTDGTDQAAAGQTNLTLTYVGEISATTDAAGAITGSGVAAGSTVNETTGAITLNTPYTSGTVDLDTNLTPTYRPRQSYHIVYKGATSPLITTDHTVSSLTQDVLTFAATILGTGTSAIIGPLRSVAYQVVKDMTLTEQATALAGIASSPSISSRRIVMVWPDIAEASISNVTTQVPGWALAACLGALVDQLPSQQGLTRRGLAGVTGRVGGKDYFRTTTRLDIIAGGGVMLFENDGVGQGVYIRHQLTTDISSILLQELSMTKNIDSVSVEIRSALDDLIGTWNVQDGLFIVAKLRVGSLINKFINTVVARIGGKMKPGSKLLSVLEDPTLPDTVNIIVDGRFPVPLNKIVLTINASA